MNKWIQSLQKEVNKDFTKFALKIAILALALAYALLALFVENKWVLAGIFAYGVLP